MHSNFVKFSAAAALATGFLLQSVLPAAAGEVQNRIDMQQHRIHAGYYNGGINARQARHDERRLAHIRRERNRDLRRNGGYVTPRENAHLNRELNRNSRDIRYQNR